MTTGPTSPHTFGNEEHLPRVPVPTLADTCRRFLEWSAPLLSAGQRAATEQAVREFLAPDSPAHELQAALEAYGRRPDVAGWLDDFWAYRYLGRRDRIALNANYFFLFHDAGEDQATRAAGLVAAALDYKLRLDDEEIPPAVVRGRPQSMVQNKFLFSATRVPGVELDSVRAPYSAEHPGPASARHVVVFHRSTPFRLDVLDADGRPYDREDLAAALQTIMKDGAFLDDPSTAAGHLTTMARAEWAAARADLIDAAPGNAAALEDIESALFCVSLDEDAGMSSLEACNKLLHGDSGNRWFDKSFSFVVFDDGWAGINVEHCWLDGTTILSFLDTLHDGPLTRQAVRGVPAVAPIELTMDDALRRTAREAAESFEAYAMATASASISFEDFGSSKIKELGMSPDAFVQMAYQLAHRRAKGMTGATYESIATRQYRHGRTEAMRVVTPEVLAFVSTMDDPAASADGRRAAFRTAAEKHVARARECQAGGAPEQHLWELQLLAKRGGATTFPALYDSPGWLVMRDDYLSTSSAPSVNVEYFGFGSTSQQCIGVAYVLLPDNLNVYLSTPRIVGGQLHTFLDELSTAVRELRELLKTLD
ncbi:MAG TPA: choline/carnitine O-acyltransferase [Actinophytocola sp.]|nr:choline/carnitine O-acyltransferase [Actinophytocola sp.]